VRCWVPACCARKDGTDQQARAASFSCHFKKKAEATKEAKIRRIRARGKIEAEEAIDKAHADIDEFLSDQQWSAVH